LLHSFENKYGRTPEILQLAFADLGGNKEGYFAPKKPLTRCGERTEADYSHIPIPHIHLPPTRPVNPKRQKSYLFLFGGAKVGHVYIDVYSGYVNGILVTSMKNSLLLVKSTEAQTNRNYIPSVFAADQARGYKPVLVPRIHFRRSEIFPENMSLPSPLNVKRPIIIIMALRISSMSLAKIKNLFVSPFFTSFATPTFPASISPVSNALTYGVNCSIEPLQSLT
jgi:hypothetical protein